MSTGATRSDLLTRDELEALLATLAEETSERERQKRPSGPFRREARGLGGSGPLPLPSLSRIIEQWAVDRGRALSTSYQTPIACEVTSWESRTLRELSETALPEDLLVVFEINPPGAKGFLLASRSLLFSQLCLAFGSRPQSARTAPPSRPYTRIEKRFLRLLATQTLASLEEAWSELCPGRSRVVSIEEPERMLDDPHEQVVVATIDVRGLADFARLRLVLPPAPFQAIGDAQESPAAERNPSVVETVLDLPVQLRVEVGETEMALSELAGMGVGDVLPLEGASGDVLIVRIEGHPKLRAIRGTVGKRLAVQVTGRI